MSAVDGYRNFESGLPAAQPHGMLRSASALSRGKTSRFNCCAANRSNIFSLSAILGLVHFTSASAVDDFQERERKAEDPCRRWTRAVVVILAALLLAIFFTVYAINIPHTQSSRVYLEKNFKRLEQMELTFDKGDETWLCPCSNSAPTYSAFLQPTIMYNSPEPGGLTLPPTGFAIDPIACPWTEQENDTAMTVDTFGSPEYVCFCHYYIKNFNISIVDNSDVTIEGSSYYSISNEYDIALKGCVLVMRAILAPTFTQRPATFVEPPLAAQQSSAIAARSSASAAGLPFSSLQETERASWFAIESLTILMASAYEVMINGSYAPGADAFWDLQDRKVCVDREKTFQQFLNFTVSNSPGSIPAAMPVINFSWSHYLDQCRPPYCDVVEHNSPVYRIFLAVGGFGGIWTALFVVIRSIVWPALEWSFFAERVVQ